MSFGGPIDSMINANKHNRKLLGKRKRLKEIHGEYKHSVKPPLKTRPVDEDRVDQFLFRFEKENRNDRQQLILIAGLTLVIILVLLLWIVSADYSSIIDVIE